VGRNPFDDSVQKIRCFRAISVSKENTGSKPCWLDEMKNRPKQVLQIPVFDFPDEEGCKAPPKL